MFTRTILDIPHSVQDFTRIYSTLGLGKGRVLANEPTSTVSHLLYFSETVAALQAFRKRHADAQRIHAQLSSQPAMVDLTHYRSMLKNKAIVDDAEKLLNEFKPVTYDVNAHVKAIETFEAKAVGVIVPRTLLPPHSFLQVSRAKETETKIDEELKELQATLANIEEARPFEDLTVGSAPKLRRTLPNQYPTGQRSRRCAPSHRGGRRDHDQEGEVDRAR